MLCKHNPAYFKSLFDFLSALKSTDGEPRALASFLKLGWTRYDPVNQRYLGITVWICFIGPRSEDACTQFSSANHSLQSDMIINHCRTTEFMCCSINGENMSWMFCQKPLYCIERKKTCGGLGEVTVSQT